MNKLPGRKIETLKVDCDGAMMLADIRMLTIEGVPEFYAVCPEFNLEARDPNLKTVRSKMEALLRGASQVTWELFYLLTTSADDNPYSDTPAAKSISEYRQFDKRLELSLKIELVEIGTLPGGKQIHRDKPRTESGWGRNRDKVTSAQEGLPEIGELYSRKYNRDDRCVAALVKATPENYERLQSLFANVAAAGETLCDIFMPEHAQRSLAEAVGLTITDGAAVPLPRKKAKRKK